VDRPNATQALVEQAFLVALAEGEAWLAGALDLEELRALCVTEECRTQGGDRLTFGDETQITIFSRNDPDPSQIQLAQYHMTSMSALEKRLSQYPKGTSFTLNLSALDPETAAATRSDLTRFADAHGLKIQQPGDLGPER
jgi:hypothetical protein